MNRPNTPISGTGIKSAHRFGLVAGMAVAGAAMFAVTAQAAVPMAGTKIGNQAFATYDNGTGAQQTTSSNIVETEVLPVYDLLLEPGSTEQVSPGGEVTWSHTLTNLGNAPDGALLNLFNQTGAFELQNVQVFLDQNEDGIPDNNTNLNGVTLPLDIGEVVHLLVVGSAPNTATDGQQDQVDLSATSANDPSIVDTDEDIAIVVDGGVVTINKSIVDTATGFPGTDDVTMRIVITNTGNDVATAVNVGDFIPDGMEYEADSASINVVNGGSVTDADDSLEPGGASDSSVPLAYSYDAATEQVLVSIPNLAVGEVIELTFDVSIEDGRTAGDITNTATVDYTANGQARNDSDDATYTVLAQPDVTMTGDTLGPQVEGAVVSLTNVITNTGTTDDDYDIDVDLRIGEPDGYPVGTTFTLLVDGAPLVSNDNNNAFPDLAVAAGASRDIVLRVTLPNDIDLTNPPAAYIAEKVAISLTDSNITATAQDIISIINPSVTDLTNGADDLNDPAFDGAGAGPEATPVSTVTGAPGDTVEIDLVINNQNDPAEGNVADNYALSADTITANPGGIGSNWLVSFFDQGGNEITVTPDIAAGSSYNVTARITIPENELASPLGTDGTSVIFRIESANSGALDAKLDSVFVATVREVVIEENGQQQTFPGGVVVYDHVVTNEGNVAEPNVTLSVTDTNLVDFVDSTIYLDVNGDGLINGGDIINPTQADIQANATDAAGNKDGSFDPGDEIAVLVRVQAQSSAASGAQNVTTLTATVDDVVNGEANITVDGVSTAGPATTSNDDTTTVVASDIQLEKFQALDTACDGDADGAYQTNPLQAEPGQCLIYRIVATNTGTRVAENLVITDATPGFTTYNGGTGPDCSGAPAGDGAAQVSKGAISSTITCGNTGLIEATVGQLLPTEPAVVMSFSVKINDE